MKQILAVAVIALASLPLYCALRVEPPQVSFQGETVKKGGYVEVTIHSLSEIRLVVTCLYTNPDPFIFFKYYPSPGPGRHRYEIPTQFQRQVPHLQVERENSTIRLKNISREDEGATIHCEKIVNEMKKAKSTFFSIQSVQEPPSNFGAVLPLISNIRLGMEAILQCHFSGYPLLIPVWTGELSLHGNNGITTRNVNGTDVLTLTLKISKASLLHDSLTAKCSVSNDYGTAQQNTTLRVMFAPNISFSSNATRGCLGDVIAMTCNASGNPIPQMTIIKGKRTLFTGLGNIFVELKLSDDSFGDYYCTASNNINSLSYKIQLFYKEPVKDANLLTFLSKSTVKAGDSVRLTLERLSSHIKLWCGCKNKLNARAMEQKLVFYNRKTKTLEITKQLPSRFFSRVLIENRVSMVISNVSIADEDFYYFCRLDYFNSTHKNTIYGQKHALTVFVLPEITNFTSNASSPLPGDFILIKCVSEGKPKPVVEIKREGKDVSRGYGETQVIILVKDESFGIYQCTASNKMASSSDKLRVIKKAVTKMATGVTKSNTITYAMSSLVAILLLAGIAAFVIWKRSRGNREEQSLDAQFTNLTSEPERTSRL